MDQDGQIPPGVYSFLGSWGVQVSHSKTSGTPLPELSAPDKCGAGGTSKNLCPDIGQGLSPTEPSSEACRDNLTH